MKKAMGFGVALVCAALLVGGCSKGFNIFAPLTPAVGTLPATVENAANSYAAGDYVAAMAQYEAVVTADPQNGAARYGYVKAYVKNEGFDIATFIKSGTGMSGAPAFFAPVADRVVSRATATLMIDDLSNPFGVNAKKMETLCTVLITYLDPIANGTCDAAISATDVGLNSSLAFAHLLKGVFLVVDPGFDGTLDYNVRDNGNGTSDIVNTAGTIITNIDDAQLVLAKAELTAAIVRLDVAITSAGGSSIWTSVREFLIQVQTKVNALT